MHGDGSAAAVQPRVKGSQLLNTVRALRTMRADVEHRIPERLRDYLDERILAGVWYPDADYLQLLQLLGRVLATRIDGNVWRFLGRSGAASDFESIYASQIRPGDPHGTMRRVSDGWRLYRDTGSLSVLNLQPDGVELQLRDYPLHCREIAEVNAGYLQGMLEASGAREVRVRIADLEEGDGGCRWLITWRPADADDDNEASGSAPTSSAG